jgi:Spore coat assembly protein
LHQKNSASADQTSDADTTAESITETEPSPYKTPTAAESEEYPQVTNLPTLYINLDNDEKKSAIDHDIYIPGTYSLVVSATEGIYNQPLEIKGRGNYSWSFIQKPYNIKLADKTDLLGMGEAKSWVLVTTYSDKTLLRNYMTLNLAVDVGLQYAVEAKYVDLYINGKYNGLYVLTEKIQINKNRVDIDENTEGLFEIEVAWRHDNNCTYCIDVPSGVHIMYKQGDVEELGADKKTELLGKFKKMFITADKAMKKGYDEFSKYIDVKSFIDWYIVNEFVKNYDSGFTTSCYCYIKNGMIYMGPPWDYDTCLGNQDAATCLDPTGYHVRTSPWYTMLCADPVFMQMLRERWTELQNQGIFDKFLSDIYAIPQTIAQSEQLDHKFYKFALKSKDLRGDKSLFTYSEEVEYLHSWVAKRIDWLDKQWKLD